MALYPVFLRLLPAAAALLWLPAGPVQADECAAVAAATVAELRAGAGDAWTENAEALARQAAGAACVKVRSGRFEAVASEPVAAAADEAGEHRETAPDELEEASGDGLWPFSEFNINDVSASPSKKPYERRRLDRD